MQPVFLGEQYARQSFAAREPGIRAKWLEGGRPELWAEFMDELRGLSLDVARLTQVYEAAAKATKTNVRQGTETKLSEGGDVGSC